MVKERRKYLNYIKKKLFSRDKLNFLILYVTSGCNFKCRTCFFHKNLNRGGDLSLAEFEKISKNLGHFSILLIGGGEPFLRSDLELICSLFVKNNKIDTLYIPTNGFLTDIILAKTEFLLKSHPDIVVSINPSLDGTGENHDRTRGVPGSFERAIQTIEKLSALKSRYKNLQIIVNSVVHKENTKDLEKLALFLRKFDIDYHAFEILRGDHKDKTLSPADLEKIRKMHDFILRNRLWYLKRREETGHLFDEAITIGQLGYTQYLKERVLAGKKWLLNCFAGRSISVIYPNGDVGLCELLGSVGNIKDFDYSLKKVLESGKAQRQLEEIKKNKCHCTHICFINSSIAADWKTIFLMPYHYLRNKFKKYEI